jgi:hypothetical protein
MLNRVPSLVIPVSFFAAVYGVPETIIHRTFL